MTTIKAIFIDRDGTIGGDTTIHYPGSFTLFPFTKASLQKLKANHIKNFLFHKSTRYRGWDSDHSRFLTRIKRLRF